jgi:nucleotide-binding universal stress UspA family protein
MRMNTIGCAIDFSDRARCAMEAAADLARHYEARLVLVHVHDAPSAVESDMLVSPPALFDAAAREAEGMLARWRADAERLAGKSVESAVVVGTPAEELVRWADDHRADLLVVGTHGRKGLPRLVLGSVAERVVRAAPCPVLVARPTPALDED